MNMKRVISFLLSAYIGIIPFTKPIEIKNVDAADSIISPIEYVMNGNVKDDFSFIITTTAPDYPITTTYTTVTSSQTQTTTTEAFEPYELPLELTIYFNDSDTMQPVSDLDFQLTVQRQANLSEPEITYYNLTSSEKGDYVYTATLYMDVKHKAYSFRVDIDMPEGYEYDGSIDLVPILNRWTAVNTSDSFVVPYTLCQAELSVWIRKTVETTTTTTSNLPLSSTTTTTTTSVNISEDKIRSCDVNNDGLVNGEDVYYIYGRFIQLAVDHEDSKAAVAEKYALTDDIIAAVDTLGDIYEDDLIDGADASVLLKYINDNNDTGDVNCDGVIDARDASVVLTYYSQQSAAVGYVDNITIERFMADVLGDYDGNGVVDARDASALLTQYAKNSVQ